MTWYVGNPNDPEEGNEIEPDQDPDIDEEGDTDWSGIQDPQD